MKREIDKMEAGNNKEGIQASSANPPKAKGWLCSDKVI